MRRCDKGLRTGVLSRRPSVFQDVLDVREDRRDVGRQGRNSDLTRTRGERANSLLTLHQRGPDHELPGVDAVQDGANDILVRGRFSFVDELLQLAAPAVLDAETVENRQRGLAHLKIAPTRRLPQTLEIVEQLKGQPKMVPEGSAGVDEGPNVCTALGARSAGQGEGAGVLVRNRFPVVVDGASLAAEIQILARGQP